MFVCYLRQGLYYADWGADAELVFEKEVGNE
jgi:hypothetical protein